MQTITLTAASGIQRSADVYTSKAGSDVGSTFFRFTCVECQNTLGRYYLTTSKDLDDLREKFTFTIDSINSYELGKSQHGKIFKDTPPVTAVDPEINDENTLVLCDNVSSKDLAFNEVNGEIVKMQHVIHDLFERICRQEQEMQEMQLYNRSIAGSFNPHSSTINHNNNIYHNNAINPQNGFSAINPHNSSINEVNNFVNQNNGREIQQNNKNQHRSEIKQSQHHSNNQQINDSQHLISEDNTINSNIKSKSDNPNNDNNPSKHHHKSAINESNKKSKIT
mmetsp:Transcript_31610/g.30145  ORF Transcript_31610/g.30145 Transcript_31610/m.30145 type:complete len:280 (+) Transcript_31610:249-1088(+)